MPDPGGESADTGLGSPGELRGLLMTLWGGTAFYALFCRVFGVLVLCITAFYVLQRCGQIPQFLEHGFV